MFLIDYPAEELKGELQGPISLVTEDQKYSPKHSERRTSFGSWKTGKTECLIAYRLSVGEKSWTPTFDFAIFPSGGTVQTKKELKIPDILTVSSFTV